MNEQDVIRNVTNTDDIVKVTLDDKICVGCNHCGNCCINTQVRLTAYDLYQMNHKFKVQEILDKVTLYFGDESHLPLVGLFSSEESGLCPFLQSDLNGDFQCILEDKQPSTCFHPFVAIATQFEGKEFSLVPFDEEVQPFDIEAYLNDNSIENSTLYYLKDRNNSCKSNCKSDITVREYLSPRLGDQNERNLAMVIPMLYLKYFDIHMLTKILHLSENSKVNGPFDDLFKGDSKLSQITKNLFTEAYFYMDDPSEEEKPFLEQTIDQIHRLETKILPKYRILYKYLLKVFRAPDEDEFDKIIAEENYTTAQKMFDKYFMDNIDEIKERFAVDMMPNMTRELKNLLRKLEEET